MIDRLIDIAQKEYDTASYNYQNAKQDWDISWMSPPGKRSQLEQALFNCERTFSQSFAALEFLKRIRDTALQLEHFPPEEVPEPEPVQPEEKTHYIIRIPKFKKFFVLHGTPESKLPDMIRVKTPLHIENFSLNRCEELSNNGYKAV